MGDTGRRPSYGEGANMMDDVMARFGAVLEGPLIAEYYEISVDY